MNLLCAWYCDINLRDSDGLFCLVSYLSFISVLPFLSLHCLIISQLPLPSWQFDVTNFLSYRALIVFGFRDIIYASSKGEFLLSELLFLLQFQCGKFSFLRDWYVPGKLKKVICVAS